MSLEISFQIELASPRTDVVFSQHNQVMWLATSNGENYIKFCVFQLITSEVRFFLSSLWHFVFN